MTCSTPIHPQAPAAPRGDTGAQPNDPELSKPELTHSVKGAYGSVGCTDEGCTLRCFGLAQTGLEAMDVLFTTVWACWYLIGWQGTPDGVAADYPGAVTLGLGPWQPAAALTACVTASFIGRASWRVGAPAVRMYMRSMVVCGVVCLLRVVGLLGVFAMASCVFLPAQDIPCTKRSASLDNRLAVRHVSHALSCAHFSLVAVRTAPI
jgi:hypothetical protein